MRVCDRVIKPLYHDSEILLVLDSNFKNPQGQVTQGTQGTQAMETLDLIALAVVLGVALPVILQRNFQAFENIPGHIQRAKRNWNMLFKGEEIQDNEKKIYREADMSTFEL